MIPNKDFAGHKLVRQTHNIIRPLHLILKIQVKTKQLNTRLCSYLCYKDKKVFGGGDSKSNSQFFNLKPDYWQTDRLLYEVFFSSVSGNFLLSQQKYFFCFEWSKYV